MKTLPQKESQRWYTHGRRNVEWKSMRKGGALQVGVGDGRRMRKRLRILGDVVQLFVVDLMDAC